MSENTISWTNELITGIYLIDIEHKTLYKYLLRLYDECMKDVSQQEVIKHIDSVLKFMSLHFKNERELMFNYNYPDYKGHITKHSLLLKEITNFKKKAVTEKVDKTDLTKLAYILTGDFKNQVLVDDKKMANYLKQNSIFRRKLFLKKIPIIGKFIKLI